MSFNTDLLHAGVVREANGATLPPVYQSSAFEQDTAADLEKIFENKAPGYCYTRVGNPTVTAFENRITKLDRLRFRYGGDHECYFKYCAKRGRDRIFRKSLRRIDQSVPRY